MHSGRPADREAVRAFLGILRGFIFAKSVIYVPRGKTLDTFAELGISYDVADDVLMHLDVGDYVEGPMDDDSGRSGDVWIFGSSWNTRRLYIKVRVTEDELYCVSFHFADGRLQFPFAGE